MASFNSEWKRLSAEYSETRERFERATEAIASLRAGYVTPTDAELQEEATAYAAMAEVRRRLYQLLGKIAPDDIHRA